MYSINLNETGDMEIWSSTNWLGMDKEVQTCTITANIDKNQPNGQDTDSQGNLDLLPFDPDYQVAEAQKLMLYMERSNYTSESQMYIVLR